MTRLTRRTLLAGTAVASAAALSPLSLAPVSASTQAAGQAPGFYRYKVGDFLVTAATDGARTFPLPDTFVQNQPKYTVSAALEEAFMPADTMTIPFTPIVVDTGSQLVLIDTGLGAGMFEQSKGAVGQLQSNLSAAGIDANAINTVIISHFHADHINGLLAADRLAFPNAEIKVPELEWSYWMDDGEMSRAANDIVKGNFNNARRVFGDMADNVTRYDPDKEVAPGITAIHTPGHTPGHMSYVIASGNARVFVQSDVTNHPALFLRNPGWHVMFDMDGQEAETTRRKTYDMVAAEKMLVQGFHFPFPSAGHVQKDGDRYRLVPVPWNPVI